MIIDANAHPTVDGKWLHTQYDASVDTLLRSLDSAGIDKAVLVPLAGVISNNSIQEMCARHSDRFIPAVSFNPAAHISYENVQEAFRKEFNESTVSVLKLHNRLHGYDLGDERLFATLQANEERGRPFVIFICGLTCSKKIQVSQLPPLALHRLVTQFSKTNFVIMHGGGAWVLQMYETIRDCPNAYLDLSYVQSAYQGSSVTQDLSYLCQRFDQRLIWGSDFPEISPKDAMDHFLSLSRGLSEEKRHNILGLNLHRLLS